MKKKEYIKPETNILQSEPQAILAVSNESIGVASEELYTEDHIAKASPLKGPCFRMACLAYSEQVG